MAGLALSQVSQKGPPLGVTIGLVAAAGLGIAAGAIPKKEKTLRSAAIGGSVLALAVTGLLFMWGD